MKRHSIFSLTGLPESFGVAILSLGFALLVLGPWLGGVSIMTWTLPEFPAEATSLLRIFGVPTFILLCLLFVPILKDPTARLGFGPIAIHRADKYWREGERTEHHHKISGRAAQYFYMVVFDPDSDFWRKHHDPVNADPVFDITVKNGFDKSLSLWEVGIAISEVAHANYLWGIPTAVTIQVSKHYVVEMPNLQERFREAYHGFDLEPEQLNEVVSSRVPDPVQLEPEALFRYTLRLENFCENMPNHVRLRMWCRTDCGEFRSDEIALLRY